MKIEIKRVDCPEGYAYWEVWLDGQRTSCERTFRKAWKQAKQVIVYRNRRVLERRLQKIIAGFSLSKN